MTETPQRRTLFLGFGGKTIKLITVPFMDEIPGEETIITLDINKELDPDVEFDLSLLPEEWGKLPFPDEFFTEIHAYEVLEHYGKQGDWKGFFREWEEYHRVLVRGGCFIGTVPLWGKQAFGDPGHVRFINGVTLSFLNTNPPSEKEKRGPRTQYPPFKGNLVCIEQIESEENQRFGFALQKQPNIDYNELTKSAP